jgi:hypothetical protein
MKLALALSLALLAPPALADSPASQDHPDHSCWLLVHSDLETYEKTKEAELCGDAVAGFIAEAGYSYSPDRVMCGARLVLDDPRGWKALETEFNARCGG